MKSKSNEKINNLVSAIVSHKPTVDLLRAHGVEALKVCWEDTARKKGSCWGPNISDMTLIVKDGEQLMPVIRKPNFSDVTQDVPIDTFKIKLGNDTEQKSRIVTLSEYLKNLGDYVSDNMNKLDL